MNYRILFPIPSVIKLTVTGITCGNCVPQVIPAVRDVRAATVILFEGQSKL
jgi:hypothetical protein